MQEQRRRERDADAQAERYARSSRCLFMVSLSWLRPIIDLISSCARVLSLSLSLSLSRAQAEADRRAEIGF